MSLSKKHFSEIAEIIAECISMNDGTYGISDQSVGGSGYFIPKDSLIDADDLILRISYFFKTENDLFDAIKFRKACKID
jgi:hypothetical protein